MTISRSTTYRCDPNEVILIGLDTDDGPDHPLYQPRVKRKIPKEQLATALEHGTSVIECTKLPGYDSPVVVSGRQRTKALRLANEELAPKDRHKLEYKLIKGDLKGLMGAMIRENALYTRQTPLEKAEECQRFLDLEGSSVEECAVMFGVTKQSIKDWTTLLTFNKAVIKAVRRKDISANQALIEFRKVEPEKQEEALEKVLVATAKIADPVTGKKREPKKRNMHKAILAHMADDPGTSLNKQCLYLLQFIHGSASKAEVSREVTGFKASYDRAKRAIKKEDESE